MTKFREWRDDVGSMISKSGGVVRVMHGWWVQLFESEVHIIGDVVHPGILVTDVRDSLLFPIEKRQIKDESRKHIEYDVIP